VLQGGAREGSSSRPQAQTSPRADPPVDGEIHPELIPVVFFFLLVSNPSLSCFCGSIGISFCSGGTSVCRHRGGATKSESPSLRSFNCGFILSDSFRLVCSSSPRNINLANPLLLFVFLVKEIGFNPTRMPHFESGSSSLIHLLLCTNQH
jgi:hypothetical protein